MNLTKLSGLLLVTALALFAAGCAKATPSPTPTPEPTATELPTNTPEPTPTEEPTPEVTETPVDQTTPDASLGTGTGTGAEQPAGTTGAQQPAGASGAQQPATTVADQYQYISQTLPDGYQVRPHTVLTITWTVKNTGSTAWGTDYSLRYFAGPEVTNTYVAFPKTISANETTQLTVTFTTPDAPGDYDLWFKLVNNQSQNFGDVNFTFTVTNTPNYGAPKPSATP